MPNAGRGSREGALRLLWVPRRCEASLAAKHTRTTVFPFPTFRKGKSSGFFWSAETGTDVDLS